MVSWGFAFKKGFILWLWCILWVIVGSLIFGVIGVGSLLPLVDVILNPTPEKLAPEALAGAMLPTIIGVIVGIFICSFIALIGVFASIVKVVTDAVEEQPLKRTLAEVPIERPTVPTPPSVAQYCPNCRRQIVDPSIVFCPDCGAKITE